MRFFFPPLSTFFFSPHQHKTTSIVKFLPFFHFTYDLHVTSSFPDSDWYASISRSILYRQQIQHRQLNEIARSFSSSFFFSSSLFFCCPLLRQSYLRLHCNISKCNFPLVIFLLRFHFPPLFKTNRSHLLQARSTFVWQGSMLCWIRTSSDAYSTRLMYYMKPTRC